LVSSDLLLLVLFFFSVFKLPVPPPHARARY
jgi:hypothetical protein